MERKAAEEKLKKLFGFSQFHETQWTVIERLLKGQRVLLIEKTGFGKSLCFQFPATQLSGVSIVFSPLIALMRDQVRKLQSLGIRAACLNSNQTAEENNKIIQSAMDNELDMLYIAPERLENISWIQSARRMKIAMVVVDEAHCISMWGHNFRPNYRRIVNLVRMLPAEFPVLATTATATKRIEEDILAQIGTDMSCIRGHLLRPNLGLNVVRVQSEEEKMLWLAQYLPQIEGTGLIYTGTRTNTAIYHRWLRSVGISSAAYNAGLESGLRQEIETGLRDNQYKCVVSTNALGMGIDKPDVRFIVHTQIPQSPIHYYQEIGRAGRDGEPAEIILLFDKEKDLRLPRSFIENAKPGVDQYQKVIAATQKDLMGQYQIVKAANLNNTQVRVVLADLMDQGIVNQMVDGKSKKYFFNPQAGELNTEAFEALREAQLKELDKMIEYVNTEGCRMEYLCQYLGDSLQEDCGVCDNERGVPFPVLDTPELREQLTRFRSSDFPVLKVSTVRSRLVDGIAASYYGVSRVGKIVQKCKYEQGGDFPEYLVDLAEKAFFARFKEEHFDLMLFVPPTESGDLVKHFAIRLSKRLEIPLVLGLEKTRSTTPQKNLRSGITKKENVKGSFCFKPSASLSGKSILVVDDILDSGATMKEVGRYLSRAGAKLIAPLVIAKTVAGDL